ncbi:MAG: FMN-binding protein [Lachnospiraceae bacterium]|nr:FMN-binding protein [Lachnospiraceae bacterium]
MKRNCIIFIALISLMSVMTACGNANVAYKDGVYTGRSEIFESEDGTDNGNGYGEVTITISNGIISECTYLTYEVDGTLKDEDYGKENGVIANKDYYNKAQKANAACAEYASMLVANGSLDGIDAISGATINYNEFLEAVDNALKQAEISE